MYWKTTFLFFVHHIRMYRLNYHQRVIRSVKNPVKIIKSIGLISLSSYRSNSVVYSPGIIRVTLIKIKIWLSCFKKMWWNPIFKVVQVSPNRFKVDIYFFLHFKIVFLLNQTCYFDEILDYASAFLWRLSNQVSTKSPHSKRQYDKCLSFHVSLAVTL